MNFFVEICYYLHHYPILVYLIIITAVLLLLGSLSVTI